VIIDSFDEAERMITSGIHSTKKPGASSGTSQNIEVI
jgi:hypothetical protein